MYRTTKGMLKDQKEKKFSQATNHIRKKNKKNNKLSPHPRHQLTLSRWSPSILLCAVLLPEPQNCPLQQTGNSPFVLH